MENVSYWLEFAVAAISFVIGWLSKRPKKK